MKKGVTNPNFKGFMAYNAQANWNVICIVNGVGNPIMQLINKEHIYLFHWI
jgi:hypothetical protein